MTGTASSYDLDAQVAALAEGLEIVAVRRLGDREDARDAVQETLARLVARLREGPSVPSAEVAPLAYGIARHVIADVLRARQRHGGEPGEVSAPGPSALDALVSADDRASVRRAMAHLSHPDRELLTRCFVDGERIGAIAEALGEPADRLRKRKSRALQRLAEALAGATARPSHGLRSTPIIET